MKEKCSCEHVLLQVRLGEKALSAWLRTYHDLAIKRCPVVYSLMRTQSRHEHNDYISVPFRIHIFNKQYVCTNMYKQNLENLLSNSFRFNRESSLCARGKM